MSNGDRILKEPADERDEKDLSKKEGGKATGNPGEKGSSGTATKGQDKNHWLEELDEILGTSFAANNAKEKKDPTKESKSNEKSTDTKTTVADKSTTEPSQTKLEGRLANSLELTPLFSKPTTALETKTEEPAFALPSMGWRELVSGSLIGQVPAAAPTPPTAAEMKSLFRTDFPFNKPNLGSGKLEAAELIKLEELVRNNRLNGTPLNNFKTKSGTDLNAADQIQLLNEAIHSSLHDRVEALTLKASSGNVSKIEYVKDTNGNDTSEIKMIYFQDGKAGNTIATDSQILAVGNREYIISAYLRARKVVNPADGLDTQIKDIAAELAAKNAANGGTPAAPTVGKPTTYDGLATILAEGGKNLEAIEAKLNGITDEKEKAKVVDELNTEVLKVIIKPLSSFVHDRAQEKGKALLNKTDGASKTSFVTILETELKELTTAINNTDAFPNTKNNVAALCDSILTSYKNADPVLVTPQDYLDKMIGKPVTLRARPTEFASTLAGDLQISAEKHAKPEKAVRDFINRQSDLALKTGVSNDKDSAQYRTFLTNQVSAIKAALTAAESAATNKLDATVSNRAKAACDTVLSGYTAGDERKPSEYLATFTDGSLKTYEELANDLKDKSMTPEEAQKGVVMLMRAKALQIAKEKKILDTTDQTKREDFQKTDLTGISTLFTTALGTGAGIDQKILDSAKTASDGVVANYNTAVTPRNYLDSLAAGVGIAPPQVVPEPPLDLVGLILPNWTPWNNLWSIPMDTAYVALAVNAIRTVIEARKTGKPLGTIQKNFTLAGAQTEWFARAADRIARETRINQGQDITPSKAEVLPRIPWLPKAATATSPARTFGWFRGHKLADPGVNSLDPTNPDHYFRVNQVFQNELQRRIQQNRISNRAQTSPHLIPEVMNGLARHTIDDVVADVDIYTDRPGKPSITSQVADESPFKGKITHGDHLALVKTLQGREQSLPIPDPLRLRAFERYIQTLTGRVCDSNGVLDKKKADAEAIWDIYTDRGNPSLDRTAVKALWESSPATTAAPATTGIAETLTNSAGFTGKTKNSEYQRMAIDAYNAEMDSHGVDIPRARALKLYAGEIKKRNADEPAIYRAHLDIGMGNTPVNDNAAELLIRDTAPGVTPARDGIATEIVKLRSDFTGNTNNGQYLEMVKDAQRIACSTKPYNPERIKAFELYVAKLEKKIQANPAYQNELAYHDVHEARTGSRIDVDAAKALIHDTAAGTGTPAKDGVASEVSKKFKLKGETTDRQYLTMVEKAETAARSTHPPDTAKLRAFEEYIKDLKSQNRTGDALAYHNVHQDKGHDAIKPNDAKALIRDTVSGGTTTDGIASDIYNSGKFTGETNNAAYLDMVQEAFDAEKTIYPPDPKRLEAYKHYIDEIKSTLSKDAGEIALYNNYRHRFGKVVDPGIAEAKIHGAKGIADTILSSTKFNGDTTNAAYTGLVRAARIVELKKSPPDVEKIKAFDLYLDQLARENRPPGEKALRWANDDIGNSRPTIGQRTIASENIAKTEMATFVSANNLIDNKTYLYQLKLIQEQERTKTHPPSEAKIEAVDALVSKWTDIVNGNAALGIKASPNGYAFIEHCKESGVSIPDHATIEAAKDQVLKPLRDNANNNPEGYSNKVCLDELRRGRMNAIKAKELDKVMAYDSLIAGDGINQGWESRPVAQPARAGLYEVTGVQPPKVENAAARAKITGANGIADTIYKSNKFTGVTNNAQYRDLVEEAQKDELAKTPRDLEKVAAFDLYLKQLEAEKRPADKPALPGVRRDIGEGAPTLEETDKARVEIAKELDTVIKANGLASNQEYLTALLKVQEQEKKKAGSPNDARIEAVDALVTKWTDAVKGNAAANIKAHPSGYAFVEHCRESRKDMPDYKAVAEAKDEILNSLKQKADKNPDGYSNKQCSKDLRDARDSAINFSDPESVAKVMAYDALIHGDGINPGWESFKADQLAINEVYKARGEAMPDLKPAHSLMEAARAKAHELAYNNVNTNNTWKAAKEAFDSLKNAATPEGINPKAWELILAEQSKIAETNQQAIERKIKANESYDQVAAGLKMGLPRETFAASIAGRAQELAAEALEKHQKLVDHISEGYLRKGQSLGIPMHSEKLGWQALAYQVGQDYLVAKAGTVDPKYLAALKDFHAHCEDPARTSSPALALAFDFDPAGIQREVVINKVSNVLKPPTPGVRGPLDTMGRAAFIEVRNAMQAEIDLLPNATDSDKAIQIEIQNFCDDLKPDLGKTPRDLIEARHNNTVGHLVSASLPTDAELAIHEYLWQNKADRANPAMAAPDLATTDPVVRAAAANYFDALANDPANAKFQADLETIRDNIARPTSAGNTVFYDVVSQARLSIDPATDFRQRDIVLHGLLEESPHTNIRYGQDGIYKNGVKMEAKDFVGTLVHELEREMKLETEPARRTQLEADLKIMQGWEADLKDNRKRAAAEAQYNAYIEARYRNDPHRLHELHDRNPHSNIHADRVSTFLILGRFLTDAAFKLLLVP